MLAPIHAFFDALLGLDRDALELESRHMAWRAAIVFVFAVLLARFADRRLLGHNSGFDIVVLVMLGSVLSRAINGQSAFFPTLGASVLLVGLHHVLATWTFNSHTLSQLVKGRPIVLVRNGQPDPSTLARGKITRDDLDEHLRLNGGVDTLERVAEARLERNGTISVVTRRDSTDPQ